VGLAGLCGLACLVASAARAAWIPPVAVSHEGLEAGDPQLAVDGGGNVTVAWVSGTPNHAIVVAEHPAGGEWTNPVERIQATNNCQDPGLAVDPAGAAILVADCQTGATPMRYASRSVNGTWSVSGEIPGSGAGEEPRVAMDDSGNAVVVWSGASSTVRSNYRKAAGGWEASALQVSPAGKVSQLPDVSVSPTGRAIAVWLEDRDETVSDPVVQVDSIGRQGSAAWSGFKFLSGTATGTVPVVFSEPQVTIGAGGRFAAWAQLSSPNPPVLSNAWGGPGDFGGWGEGGSHTSLDAGYETETPRVALDDSGRAVATWRARKISNGDFIVRAASTGSINDSWSSQVTLATGGNGALQPDVAIDPGGDATVVWRLGGTVSALTRPPGGSLASPGVPISNSAHPGFGEPRVAMDTRGDGIAAWSSPGTTSTHIAVAVNDVTPPTISFTAPVPVVAGSAVGLNAIAADTWSPTSLSWDFGDGTAASGNSVSHVYASAGAKTATVTATDAAGNNASVAIPVTVMPAPGKGGSGSGRHRVVLTATVVKQPWQKIEKAKAIKLRCKLDVAGTCAAKASIGAPVAKRIGLKVGKGQKQVAVGKGFAQAKAGQLTVVKVKLTGRSLGAIAAAIEPVAVTIAVTGSAAGSDSANLTSRLKIPRP
jgi:PKD repeat protein